MGLATDLPTPGGGKQSVWLAASGRRCSSRVEARTHRIVREKKSRGTWQDGERGPAVLPL